jgi:hypothetical protein
MDVAGLMGKVGITSGPWLNPTSGTFVVAYAIHKVSSLSSVNGALIEILSSSSLNAAHIFADDGSHQSGNHALHYPLARPEAQAERLSIAHKVPVL